MSKEEDDNRTRELIESAVPADFDLAEQLVILDGMATQMRVDPALKKAYEKLRDELVPIVAASGSFYLVDEHGNKRYAIASVPEIVDIDVKELVRMNKAGQISDELLDEIAPRRADKERYRQAGRTQQLKSHQIAATGTIRRGTGHVSFINPRDDR